MFNLLHKNSSVYEAHSNSHFIRASSTNRCIRYTQTGADFSTQTIFESQILLEIILRFQNFIYMCYQKITWTPMENFQRNKILVDLE